MNRPFIPIDPRAKQKVDLHSACKKCFRPQDTCLCDKVTPVANKLRVVILQHPQEKFKLLNSARLTHLTLKNSALFVGLSWPNFKKVAGPEAMPSQWAVLYLTPDAKSGRPVTIIDRKKNIIEDTSFLRGIIALDGSWKQAKTLWWRNSWLLKCNRISLNLDHPSLRPQVKEEGLSTIEAVAGVLEQCGEEARVAEMLRDSYKNLIITR